MKYDFYNWYTIDDSNIGCDMVIVSQCWQSWSDMPNHIYKSICELIADCPAIRQLEKDCVVDFFNEDWSRQYNPRVPKYLKLNSSWCIERAPVDCPCEDTKVKAMRCDDEAWYLIEKLEWTKSEDWWLYWIDIQAKWCNLLQIVPSWPNNPYTRTEELPAWSWTIKYKAWGLEYVPDIDPEVWSNTSYAVWYHKWGSAEIPMEDWSTIWCKNSWSSVVDWYSFSNYWDTLLRWTKDIIKWRWKHLFWLTRPWVYVISMNSCAKIIEWAWVKAIRWWIILDASWTQTSKYAWLIAWDFKYDGRPYSNYVDDFYCCEDEDKPHFVYQSQNLPLQYMSFNSSYVLHLKWISMNNPVWICFRVRVDTRLDWDPRQIWYQSKVNIELTNDWDFEPWSLTPIAPNQWTNTTITCCRVWDYPTLTEDLIVEW